MAERFDLSALDRVRAGILGDPALDVYWICDMGLSEPSRETGLLPYPVVREKMSPGAAGNLLANMAALGPRSLSFCGAVGDDWRGYVLRLEMEKLGCDTKGLFTEEGRMTQTYCKPMVPDDSGQLTEQPRVDFAPSSIVSPETERKILDWLDEAETALDVLCVCDQSKTGAVTPRVRERLSSMTIPVIADSRDNIGRFRGIAAVKPNEEECARALIRAELPVPKRDEEKARALASLTGCPVWMTLGSRGSLYVADPAATAVYTPAYPVTGQVDVCGAGDSSLSAFALTLAAGAPVPAALDYAARASHVTVKKIGMTGTATREELLSL